MSRTKLRRGDRYAIRAAIAIITVIPVSAWFATTAKASPATDAYAARNGQAVCATLDAFPTFNGIMGIADAITAQGYSYFDAGQIEATAVINYCPRHANLLRRFIQQGASPVVPAPAASIGGTYIA